MRRLTELVRIDITSGGAPASATAPKITIANPKHSPHDQPYIAPTRALCPRMPAVRRAMCTAVNTSALPMQTASTISDHELGVCALSSYPM